jgi:hypothetical protein
VTPAFTADEAIVVGRNGAARDDAPPFDLSFDVPLEATYSGHTAESSLTVSPPSRLIFTDNFELGDLSFWSQAVQ